MVTLAGCTDSPTGITAENARIGIVGGNLQVARVTEELPEPLGVEVRAGTRMVSGVAVCFVATTNGTGAPRTPCTQTDGNGRASIPWTLGTVAGDHSVEARAVEGEELHAGDPPASLSLCRTTHRTWKNAHVATMPCRSTHPSVSGATQAER
jgi:hypothetical protein